jgi:hypothetical protein
VFFLQAGGLVGVASDRSRCRGVVRVQGSHCLLYHTNDAFRWELELHARIGSRSGAGDVTHERMRFRSVGLVKWATSECLTALGL